MIQTHTTEKYYFLHEQRQTTTYSKNGYVFAKSTLIVDRNICSVVIYKGTEVAICEYVSPQDVADFIATKHYQPELYPDCVWERFIEPEKRQKIDDRRVKLPELGTYVLHHYGKHHVFLGTYSSAENAAWELNADLDDIIKSCYYNFSQKRDRLKHYFVIAKKN